MARTVLAANPNRSATCRAAALSQACPTASSKRLLKGAFARQLRHFLHLDAAIRAAHPIHFHQDCRAELHARQIAHLTFVRVVRSFQFASASGTNQLLMAAFTPDPELQRLGFLIDFVPVHSVPWPSQQFG